jgi:hypothetical protein
MLNQHDGGEPQAGWEGASFTRVIAIPSDPQVAAFEAAGKSLLDLDPASPAVAALQAWELYP